MKTKTSLKSPESPQNLQLLLNMIDRGLDTFKLSGIFREHSCDSRNNEDLIVGLLRHSLYREAVELCKEGKLRSLNRLFDGIHIDKPAIDAIVEEYKNSIK